MKTLSCSALLISVGVGVTAFAQVAPKVPTYGVSIQQAKTGQNCSSCESLRSGHEFDCGRDGRFVELSPSADQNITGPHSLTMRNSADPNFLLDLNPVNIPIEEHNSFAIGIDLYTHAEAGFRAPYINFYKSRGTRSSPAPVTLTGYELDSIGGINFGAMMDQAILQALPPSIPKPTKIGTPPVMGGTSLFMARITGPSGTHNSLFNSGG